jgi:hypothetical protein
MLAVWIMLKAIVACVWFAAFLTGCPDEYDGRGRDRAHDRDLRGEENRDNHDTERREPRGTRP